MVPEEKAKTEVSEHEKRIQVGNQILSLLEGQTSSPSEALMLMQQLTIFIWNHYQLDWKGVAEHPVSETRKQRFLDFISALVDSTGYQEPEKPAS
jgi:hypothetical protein